MNFLDRLARAWLIHRGEEPRLCGNCAWNAVCDDDANYQADCLWIRCRRTADADGFVCTRRDWPACPAWRRKEDA